MMVVKTDFMPARDGQHASTLTRTDPAAKFIPNTGLAILTFLAIFSGLLASQENMEAMGISLGPNHV